MGILDPSCVAAGPGNSIYVFARAQGYGDLARLGEQYLIAKSTNPAAFTEMIWSTVATISTSAFSSFGKASTCAVDDQGVVTIFGYPLNDPSRVSVIRYDPSAPSVVGVESIGPGGWMDITVNNAYSLSRDRSLKSQAFYVKDTVGGTQKLIHLTSDRYGGSFLQFGAVDEATKTLSHAANWTMSAQSVAYGNNELYVYTAGPTTSKVLVYPLTNLTSTIPPSLRVLNANSTSSICSQSTHFLSGVWANSYSLVCTFDGNPDRDHRILYTFSNATQNGSASGSGTTTAVPLGDINFFIPVTATPEYAFMIPFSSEDQETNALIVSGASTGTVMVKSINVPESFRVVPPPEPKISRRAVVGITLGAIVLLVILTFFYCRRKRRLSKNDDKKSRPSVVIMD